jgi:hypothetical protein
MSSYRRWQDGRTERWEPELGDFVECPADEPENKTRKHDEHGNPTEGLIITPGEWFDRGEAKVVDGVMLVPVNKIIESLKKQIAEQKR